MKATKVDKDLCIGCGLCCGICDEVFRMNEQGKAEAYQPENAEKSRCCTGGHRLVSCVCNRLGRLIQTRLYAFLIEKKPHYFKF